MGVESGAVSSNAKCRPGDFIELDYEGEVFHGKVEEIDAMHIDGHSYMDVRYISPASDEGRTRRTGSIERFFLRRYVRHLRPEEIMKYKLSGLVVGW